MTNCAEGVEITMRAAVLDVTPDDATPDNTMDDDSVAMTTDDAAPVPAGLDPALVAAGEALFRQCASCHQLGDGARNTVGPMLNGIHMAAAGTREGFRYSPAMRAAGEQGLIWDDATLAAYLTDPRGFMPGNRMAFRGLSSEDDIAAVTAYIRATGGE